MILDSSSRDIFDYDEVSMNEIPISFGTALVHYCQKKRERGRERER